MTNTLYTNLNLFDGVNNKIQNNSNMLVDDVNGKIIEVNTTKNGDRTINLNNQYVMPGLFNVHTHISLDPNDAAGSKASNQVTTTVKAVGHLRELLKSGVTYVRGCGCKYEELDTSLAQMERMGTLKQVPSMMPAGQPMTMTGGHGDVHGFGHIVDSPDEMRKGVRENFKNGARCIKVMASGGVTSPQDNMFQPQLKVPEIKVAVEEAHSKGSIVAAHAQGNPGIMNAILSGVDSIEHGCYINDEEIKMMLKQNTYLTPTLCAPCSILNQSETTMPDYIYKQTYDVAQAMFKNINNAYKKGVKITLGTDAGSPFNKFSYTPKELEYLVTKIKMSNFDALSTILNSAQLMKVDNEYGSLEKGKYANFLVLKNNPLDDIKAVQQDDKEVYKNGVREF